MPLLVRSIETIPVPNYENISRRTAHILYLLGMGTVMNYLFDRIDFEAKVCRVICRQIGL